MARFVPVVRPFITAFAGVGKMPFSTFATFSAIGALLWVVLVTLAGYFLGNVEFVKKNLELILILVVLISVVPIVIEYTRQRQSRPAVQ